MESRQLFDVTVGKVGVGEFGQTGYPIHAWYAKTVSEEIEYHKPGDDEVGNVVQQVSVCDAVYCGVYCEEEKQAGRDMFEAENEVRSMLVEQREPSVRTLTSM